MTKRAFRLLAMTNVKLAKAKWFGHLGKQDLQVLRSLTETYGFAIALGDLTVLDGKWYVTHTGLLRLAARSCCRGIRVQQIRDFCDPMAGRWVFKASVYKSPTSKGFVGFGDADPSNVSSLVHGAELRIAETRAVNRALRKAYGIGLCSVEELGALPQPVKTSQSNGSSHNQSGPTNGQSRLKDKLTLLIRQHNLDPTLVKAYATHFCGTETLRGASRELVESFITYLEKEAREDRDALLCKLNSYSHPVEVRS